MKSKAPKIPLDQLDSWKKFTKKLYSLADADPGYYCILASGLPEDQKKRIAIAWCAFYNLGIAAKASQYKTSTKFYEYLHSVYPTAKRNSERRHFRGAAGLNALRQWQTNWKTPEKMADYITNDGNAGTYFNVRARTNTVALMGPYFAWKWCDLTEVLYGQSIDFTDSESSSPSVPQQGAALLFPENTVAEAYAEIVRYGRFAQVPTNMPHRNVFGIGEAETVCCVFKQMASGKYVYGLRAAKAIARLDSMPGDASSAMAEGLLSMTPYDRKELSIILEEHQK